MKLSKYCITANPKFLYSFDKRKKLNPYSLDINVLKTVLLPCFSLRNESKQSRKEKESELEREREKVNSIAMYILFIFQ